MMDGLKRLFERQLRDSAAASSADREKALRLATAALLFEIVRADGEVRDEERTVMRAAIQSTFDLPAEELNELIRLAEESSRRAVSIYEFTQLVDEGFSPEQKKRIVELLWLVAFSDAQKHALEEHLLRKIAGLLHVSHPDFIDAKLRARDGRQR